MTTKDPGADSTGTGSTATDTTASTAGPVSLEDAPLLTVTRGNPSAEELAAVTAVVLALQTGEDDNESTATPARPWARRAQLHLPPKPGAGSWRRSSR